MRWQRVGKRAASLALISLTYACSDDEACMGLEKGEKLRMTILEPYAGPDPPRACAADLAAALMFEPDTEISGKVRGFSAGDDEISCTPALLNIQPIGDWSWTFRKPDPSTSGVIAGRYEITNGQCTATARFTVYDSAKDTLNVTLESGSESCPSPCSVTFYVRIERL